MLDVDALVNEMRQFGEPLLLVRAGSHAYGTNVPTSDEDVRGIVIPQPRLLSFGEGEFKQFAPTKGVGGVGSVEGVDRVYYGLERFFSLAMGANPNILELLWTEGQDVLFEHPAMAQLRAQRDVFLSQKVRYTYSGYAYTQLKRIKGHHKQHTNPRKEPPSRGEFGLPEFKIPGIGELLARVQARVDALHIDFKDLDEPTKAEIMDQIYAFIREFVEAPLVKWDAVAQHMLPPDLFDLAKKEQAYKRACDDWKHYQTWLKERNPSRAALEKEHGYDTKHAMHLVRLLRMAEEILTTGQVLVKRPDAEDLLRIRAGAMSFDDLLAWAEAQDVKIGEIREQSPLPRGPDQKGIIRLYRTIVQAVYPSVSL